MFSSFICVAFWVQHQATTQFHAIQVLPLVPPEDVFWSPYSGLDALCGNTLMISLDELVNDGLLDKSDLPKAIPVTTADFFKVCWHTSVS